MSEWLDIMLGEIARKQEEDTAAREEAARRQHEKHADGVARLDESVTTGDKTAG
jgi:hypothetical protein